jgi:hypothetical protein
MGFIWRLSTPSTEDREKPDGTDYTWKDYALKVFELVIKRHQSAVTIIFVNDPYDLEVSIKDSEHERRASDVRYTCGSKNIFMKRDDKFPTSKEFQNLFTNSQNKIRLQLFLKEEFVILAQEHKNIRFIYSLRRNCWDLSSEKGCSEVDEFKCSHIEADSILLFIYSQLRQSDKTTVVVIDAEDTDVVVLCAHVAHKIEGVLGLKRKKSVLDCKKLCTADMASIIVPLHIHTGADAVSGFYGCGKKAVFGSVAGSIEARDLLKSVGSSVPATKLVYENMERFTVKYIYRDPNCLTLSKVRASKWKALKSKSTLRLPPDRDSHELHIQRVNYQVYILLNYDKPDAPPSPIENGWFLENGTCKPRRYRQPAIPKTLSDIFSQNSFDTTESNGDSDEENINSSDDDIDDTDSESDD